MSGAEAGFVVGLISGVISIIEATKTVYDAAKDARGQPEAFRQVATRLPLVIEILRSAEERAQALDEMAQETLEHIVKSCKAKAEKLQEIF
jgi:PII-like signaling protein